MIIISLDTDGYFGPEARMRKNVKYVMADALAAGIQQQGGHHVNHFEKFDDYYKKYEGQDLNGKSIMVWRTGGFGDLLFVSSLIRAMGVRYPKASINVATSARFRDIWEHNKDLAARRAYFLPIPFDTLMRHDYHLKFEGTIENDKDPDQLPAVDRFAQEASIELDEIEKLPYYPGVFGNFTTARNKVYNKFNVRLRPLEYACIQFKSSSIVRDWNYNRMIELANLIVQKYNIPVLILGNGFYMDLINQTIEDVGKRNGIETDPRVLNLTEFFDPGRGIEGLRFLYSSALISNAKFVVTVDSALVHVAAGTYTPCVSLYGPFPGKIRTLYYPRNITLEHPDSCHSGPCLIHTRSGDGENVLPVNTCKPTSFEQPFNFCRMMSSITVDNVMDAVDKADQRWGKETIQDRMALVKIREQWRK